MSKISTQSLRESDGKSSTGLDEGIACLLAYLFWWVGGLVFFLIEKKSKYVKFHAMQSLIFGGVLFVVWLIFDIISSATAAVAINNALLNPAAALNAVVGVSAFGVIATILILATYAVLIIAMVFSFQKKEFVMPIIGEQAYKIATK